MKYLHASKTFNIIANGKIIWNSGNTYNVGRNKAKRIARGDKPRKHWPFLNNR